MIPVPKQTRSSRVYVGSCGNGDVRTDFSSSLPAEPGTGVIATLAWTPGAWPDPTATYLIYQGTVAGGAVNMAAPVDSLPANPDWFGAGGFGIGLFGVGLFGESATPYVWRSKPLGPGVWNFAVVPVDATGNSGTPQAFAFTITTPPQAIPQTARNVPRITGNYVSGTRTITLSWSAASP